MPDQIPTPEMFVMLLFLIQDIVGWTEIEFIDPGLDFDTIPQVSTGQFCQI